eukprot:NODE_9887_length_1392_cov_13.286166.p1 GENE.NODE_9887_length_1392_cov_13.286166~~NODE_9887_length_1392_cov_13.286166.p1  ORF type:complete len:358 (+),score=43.03 NODE_9887_length_1392_cov_13.286166:111-1184(+)
MLMDYNPCAAGIQWALLVFEAINLLSLCGCIWLLRQLWRLPPPVRRRLFPLQLASLAAADIVFHLTSIPTLMTGFLTCPLKLSEGFNQFICLTGYNSYRVAKFICVFCEVHIAVIFLWQSSRCCSHVVTRAARATLVLPWLAGLVVGAVVVQSAPPRFDPEYVFCYGKSGWDRRDDNITGAVLLLSFVIGVASYVSVLLRSWASAPGSVQRSNFFRAAMYNFNFILTFGMFLCVYYFPSITRTSFLWRMAGGFEMLNGLLNTLTYALQSNYRRMLSGRQEELGSPFETRSRQFARDGADGEQLSFRVAIGGVDVIDLTTISTVLSSAVDVEPHIGDIYCREDTAGSDHEECADSQAA